ncbi:MAG: hypothetical protein M1827_001828 [Pycnora praestabilis]|nr:MAG: hypothetical protein M1827_001828 [Pycnora praestabilis]
MPLKRLRLEGWTGQLLSPRTRPCCLRYQRALNARPRSTNSAVAQADDGISETTSISSFSRNQSPQIPLTQLPSPTPEAALNSAKLSALHSRLSLPERVPLQTFARTLVDPSADPNPTFNNGSLSILGGDLLGYYTSEYLISHYPRLPMTVLFAAMWAYVGPKTLAAITQEWGVEVAAEPGGEVDPGLLQLKRLPPGSTTSRTAISGGSGRPHEAKGWRRGVSSRIVYDDPFGDLRTDLDIAERPELAGIAADAIKGVTLERASTNFVRAVVGAIYLHSGRPAAKTFFKEHILSRQLSISALFDFKQPTRDLSRLCAREGFEPPVARLISETGRKSRHPVFVVGVYSGQDKLGEGSGGSLDEARIRAAVAALKGWYLYRPLDVVLPSDAAERRVEGKVWRPVMIDGGEVVV